MKMVIYFNSFVNEYRVTTRKNYHSYVQDARIIQSYSASEWSPQEIIDYYCKYCRCEPDDFDIML